MIFLIAFTAALIFSITFSKIIRKHSVPFYLAAAIISITVVYCTWQHVSFPVWFESWIWPLFARGALAGALFVMVMVTGALPNDSKAFKVFMPERANLSIIACILTFGHNIAYGKTYFTALFFTPSRLSLPTLSAALCSLVMIIIMLPLFITSFSPVRKRMKYHSWKRLQRFAYLFYALLYGHIMLLAIPNAIKGRSGYTLTVFVYSLVFLSYLICRLIKRVSVQEKTTGTLRQKQIAGFLCGVMMAGLILISVINAAKAAAVRDELETLQAALEHNSTADTAVPAVSEAKFISENTDAGNEEDSSLFGQMENEIPAAIPSAGKYRDGIYTGSAKGSHGSERDVEVSVTIENDIILSIEITGFRDDEEYFSPSIEGADMIEGILGKQSPYVDVVTGATESSEGLIRAVSAALNQARNP